MKKLFYFAIIIFFFSLNINAQIEKHVQWEFSTEEISEDEIILVFEATIDEGWDLYSPNNTLGGAMPMKITYEDETNFQKVGEITENPKPINKYDDIFEKEVIFFENEATFKQQIKIVSNTDFTISVTLKGQICYENGRCMQFVENYDFHIKGVTQNSKNNIDK